MPKGRRGFSIIDLTVSLGVIGILVTLLLPVLAQAQEAARRVACSTNMRQVGMGLQLFAYDNDDRLPSSAFRNAPDGGTPQDTIFIRLDAETRAANSAASPNGWDGLGLLYSEEYISAPGTFYCPSHRGIHSLDRYLPEFENQPTDIAGNFQYRLTGSRERLSRMPATLTLLSDAIRTRLDYNHGDGNNMFKADLSVSWYADEGGAIAQLLSDDPISAKRAVISAWKVLDEGAPPAHIDGHAHEGH